MMVNYSSNIWEIPPIGGAQIWIDSQKIVKETNKPDVAMFDNAPNDVSIWSFFGRIFIGIIIGVCVWALLLGVLTAISWITGTDSGTLNPMIQILLPVVWFIVWFIWNLALAWLYNIFFSKRYYNFGKMFWLIFVSSLIIFLFFFAIYSLCASLFNKDITLLYTVLWFQIIFELFISINLIDFLSQPNYSASSLMGNMLWCILSIVLHLVIIKIMMKSGFNILFIIASAMVTYTMTVLGSGIWDAIYYKFYEWWNNPFYLPSLNELREERQKEEAKQKEEEEEVNVEVK